MRNDWQLLDQEKKEDIRATHIMITALLDDLETRAALTVLTAALVFTIVERGVFSPDEAAHKTARVIRHAFETFTPAGLAEHRSDVDAYKGTRQ